MIEGTGACTSPAAPPRTHALLLAGLSGGVRHRRGHGILYGLRGRLSQPGVADLQHRDNSRACTEMLWLPEGGVYAPLVDLMAQMISSTS